MEPEIDGDDRVYGRFTTEKNMPIYVARRRTPLPPALVDGATHAEKVYIGQSPESGDAVAILVVGEIAVKVELTANEAALFFGILTGSATPPGKE